MSEAPEGTKAVPGPCPLCKARELHIEQKLIAGPRGTFSLAGEQLKFPARQAIMLICRACGGGCEGDVFDKNVYFDPAQMKAQARPEP